MNGRHTLSALAGARSRWRTALGVVAAALLAGCAGQVAYQKGQYLVGQNRMEEGLPQLQQAAAEDPRSGEYQKALLISRERAVQDWLKDADRALVQGRTEDAERLYVKVLQAHPENDYARRGLADLQRKRRQDLRLEEARQSVGQSDWVRAGQQVREVLSESPAHASALALQAQIRQAQSTPPVDAALSAAFRQPISIEFRDVSLRQAFEVVSRTSGLNFVFDKDVKTDQKTSIFLKNSTVESALYYLLLTNQLEQQVMNANTILVFPNVPAKVKDYQELSVKSFTMTNTDVKQVAASLKTLFKGRDVVIDEKLNMLVVRDTPDAIRQIERIVALHDVPEPEVMLEVEILEVSRSRLTDLGVRWPDSLTLTPLASDDLVGLTVDDLKRLGARTLGATLPSAKINLRGESGEVNILANPRIRVVNKEKAKILIGDRVPNITVNTTPQGGFSESVNYIDVGLKLDVEPTIYRGNDVVIRIGLEVSNITDTRTTKLGTVAYTFGTRTAMTTLRLKDGENQMLAGLINDEDRRSANKVPGVGELPVLNRLLGSSLSDGKKSEIILSITPRLVRNVQRAAIDVREFRSGTDGSLRERPEMIDTTPVASAPKPVAPAALDAPAATAVAAPSAGLQAAVPRQLADKTMQTRIEE